MKNIYEIIVPVVIVIACLMLGFLNHHSVKLVKAKPGQIISIDITKNGEVKVVPTVQVPVKVAPAVVATVAPVAKAPVVASPVVTPVHTLTPTQAASVVHAAGPYMNHGNFIHGNSNPSYTR